MTYPNVPSIPLKIRKGQLGQSQTSSSLLTLGNNTSQVTATANFGTVLPPTKPLLRSTWTTVGRMSVKKQVAFETRLSLTVQKSSHFKVLNAVTNSKASSWEAVKRVNLFKTSRWNIYSEVRTFKTARFNTLFQVVLRNWALQSASPGNITAGIVHPIDVSYPAFRRAYYGLSEPIVMPIDQQIIPDAGMTVQPGIQWRVGINPSGRVQSTKQMLFNDLYLVRTTKQGQWRVIQRYAVQRSMLFNVYNKLTEQLVIEWVVGGAAIGHIRQLAQVRMDFAY